MLQRQAQSCQATAGCLHGNKPLFCRPRSHRPAGAIAAGATSCEPVPPHAPRPLAAGPPLLRCRPCLGWPQPTPMLHPCTWEGGAGGTRHAEWWPDVSMEDVMHAGRATASSTGPRLLLSSIKQCALPHLSMLLRVKSSWRPPTLCAFSSCSAGTADRRARVCGRAAKNLPHTNPCQPPSCATQPSTVEVKQPTLSFLSSGVDSQAATRTSTRGSLSARALAAQGNAAGRQPGVGGRQACRQSRNLQLLQTTTCSNID